MALATQCPHCQTIFRVAHDQLKLRTGLVRCGKCKEVFNGIEHLLPTESPPQAAPPSVVETKEQPASNALSRAAGEIHGALGANSKSRAEFIDFFDLLGKPSESPPAPKAETETVDRAPPEDDPLQRMTLINLHQQEAAAETASEDETRVAEAEEFLPPAPEPGPDPIEKAIEDLHRKPPRVERRSRPRKGQTQPHSGEPQEPGFVKSGRRRERVSHALRLALAIGSVALLIGALGQSAYLFRSQIADRVPQTRPVLEQVCAVLGCKVGLPAQIDTVAIESSELQSTAAKETFVLSALLRNRSGTTQEWPHIELTLNDAAENPIARRVFAPSEYLRSTQIAAKGIEPASEQPIKIYLELGQLKASGYRVYLFYP